MIYLDNAATTLQKPEAVSRAVFRAMHQTANPGRGGHPAAMRAAELAYAAREQAAALFDAEPEQVVWTMNATHGLNLAIRTLVRPNDQVVISGFEHNAVLRPLYAAGARITVADRSLFDPERTFSGFDRAITPQTKAVVVNHVSNVFGYIQPVERIAALCRQRGVPLIVDASQSAGVLPISLNALCAAFIAMPGHKGLYGPQGTGILLCGRTPEPLLFGGTGTNSLAPEMPAQLPERVEAGTQNVHGTAGLLEGMRFVRQRQDAILLHEKHLRELLCEGLSGMPGVVVYDGADAQTGVVSFVARDKDCEALADRLAERQIAVRAGLHCAPEAHKSAGTLESGTVRASVSAFTTEQQIRSFLRAVKEIL